MIFNVVFSSIDTSPFVLRKYNIYKTKSRAERKALLGR